MAVNYSTIKSMKSAKIGTIMPWSGDGNEGFALSNIPKGWIVCDGLLKNAVDYPLLAAQLGDSYGASDDFGGNFPEYIGQFRVPNMTLKMPIDLEPDNLQQIKYQYGQTDAYQQLVSNPFDGSALVEGFGSISLTTPIDTSISANCDIDFTVDATLVMVGKMTNISIAPPDFSATVYTVNRKLGINHTPSHSHPGTYSKATAQFSGPEPFSPSRVQTGGPVSGVCGSRGYSECQFSDPAAANSWQNGINQISYYGDETHEYTLPTTDRFYDFADGSQYWGQVPAQSWPPPGPHPSGLQAASNLQYTFFGSAYTEPFDTNPVKNHAQPAWTGVFPRPMEAGNRRNHFGPASGYNPDTVSPFQVSGVNFAATTTSITLPAGTDIGTNQDAIVPLMWVYANASSGTTATAGALKPNGSFLLYDDLTESSAGHYAKELNQWAYVGIGEDEGFWSSMNQDIEQNISMSGGGGSGMVLRMRFEPWGSIDGTTTSTGGINFGSGMKLYEDPSSPQGNNPNTDVTSSGYYSRNLDQWAYIDDGSGGQYWTGENDFFEGIVPVTGGSGQDATLRVRVEAWPQPFSAGGPMETFALRWSARFVNQDNGTYDSTGESNPTGGGSGTWKESSIGDWSYRVANVGGWTDGSGSAIVDNVTMLDTGNANGTGINVQIEYRPHVVQNENGNDQVFTKIRINSISSYGDDYVANDVLTTQRWNDAPGTADRVLKVLTAGGLYPGNTRYKIIEVVEAGYDYQSGDKISFEFNTDRRVSLGLPSVEIYSGASGVIEVTDASAPGTGGQRPINTRYKVISVVNGGSGYGNGETLNFTSPITSDFNGYFKISSNGVYAGGEVLSSSSDIRPGTQVTTISKDSSGQYVIGLSQTTTNTNTSSGVTLNFQHGTYPTTLNNVTDQLDPNSSTFLGHNHGSFELNQTVGSLAAPTVFPVNNISLGDVAPENINDALNIVAEVAMPALVTTFIIKAY